MKKLKDILKKVRREFKKFILSIARNFNLIGLSFATLIFISLIVETLMGEIGWTKYEIVVLLFTIVVFIIDTIAEIIAKKFEKEKEKSVLQIVIKNNTKGE